MRDFHDPYSQEVWTQTEKEMLSVIELRWQMGGFVIGPDNELMIIRHPIDEIIEAMQANHGVNAQSGLHIQIADLRSGVRNLILSKAHGTNNDGNYLEAYELDASGDPPAAAMRARLTSSGVFTDLSAAEFKENLRDLTEEQIENILENGKIYLFNYIKEPSVLYAGPTAEEFHELTGLGDIGSVSPKSLAGIALRLVQWVWKKVDKHLSNIDKRMSKSDKRLAKIEAHLNLAGRDIPPEPQPEPPSEPESESSKEGEPSQENEPEPEPENEESGEE